MESYIDFANKDFNTAVFTNVLSTDGYEVENLIDKTLQGNSQYPSRYQERNEFATGHQIFTPRNGFSGNNGFMADYFTKPPVDIVFQFPCLVDIDCISINHKSGEKRVSDLTVSVANLKPLIKPVSTHLKRRITNNTQNNKICTKSEHGQIVSNSHSSHFEGFPCRFEPDLSVSEIRKENISSMHLVGKFHTKDFSCDKVLFRNPRSKRNDTEASSKQIFPFFSIQFLYATSHLIVRIYRTEGSTVVAINRVEIWGRPSQRNGVSINKHIYHILEMSLQQNILKRKALVGRKAIAEKPKRSNADNINKEDSNSDEKSISLNNETNSVQDFSVPEEFLDPITLEVMVLPVLLPSGHTIDSTTLEKCKKEDERKGRVPVDPFTGIPLNHENKAIPNTALKYRLDNFMLQNELLINGSFKTRTTGVALSNVDIIERVKGIKWKTKNDQVGGISNKRARTVSSEAFPNVFNEKAENCDGILSQEAFQGKNDEALLPNRNLYNGHHAKAEAQPSKSSLFFNASRGMEDSQLTSKHSHEDTLKDSLETALQKVIKFASIKVADTQKRKLKKVWVCNACCTDSKETHFFKLPCSHLICRCCLIENTTSNKCKSCQKDFLTNEVSRVHFSAYFDT